MKFTIITGATGGLGKAFTNECAKLGHNLFLTATNQERLDNLKQEILNKFNINIITKACDLSNYKSIEELLNFIDKQGITINTLINNAGYITEGSFKHSAKDTLLKCIQVNCEGVVHLTKGILDIKQPQNNLNILSITSMAGEYSMPYMAIYSATKAMLNNLMTSISIEYRKDNVHVLTVEPGAIATSDNMKEAINSQGLKGRLSSVAPEKIARKSLKLLQTHKKHYIPGFFNKLTIFASSFLTKNTRAKVAGKMWKKSQEKRNIK